MHVVVAVAYSLLLWFTTLLHHLIVGLPSLWLVAGMPLIVSGMTLLLLCLFIAGSVVWGAITDRWPSLRLYEPHPRRRGGGA